MNCIITNTTFCLQCPTCSCSIWDPSKCLPSAMAPDSNGECSCPFQHRCEEGGRDGAGDGDDGNGCIDDLLPLPPDDSCPYSKAGECDAPGNCAVIGTPCRGLPISQLRTLVRHEHSTYGWLQRVGCITSLLAIENEQVSALDVSGNALTALNDGSLFSGTTELRWIILRDNNLI